MESSMVLRGPMCATQRTYNPSLVKVGTQVHAVVRYTAPKDPSVRASIGLFHFFTGFLFRAIRPRYEEVARLYLDIMNPFGPIKEGIPLYFPQDFEIKYEPMKSIVRPSKLATSPFRKLYWRQGEDFRVFAWNHELWVVGTVHMDEPKNFPTSYDKHTNTFKVCLGRIQVFGSGAHEGPNQSSYQVPDCAKVVDIVPVLGEDFPGSHKNWQPLLHHPDTNEDYLVMMVYADPDCVLARVSKHTGQAVHWSRNPQSLMFDFLRPLVLRLTSGFVKVPRYENLYVTMLHSCVKHSIKGRYRNYFALFDLKKHSFVYVSGEIQFFHENHDIEYASGLIDYNEDVLLVGVGVNDNEAHVVPWPWATVLAAAKDYEQRVTHINERRAVDPCIDDPRVSYPCQLVGHPSS